LTLFDIKHADARAHLFMTGSDNSLILSNFSALGASDPPIPIEVRVPVIPAYNDDPADMAAIAGIIACNPCVQSVILLGYHPLGRSKIYAFDHQNTQANIAQPSRAKMSELADLVRSVTGLPVTFR
jgi:pyruvate formate lyase activating enzyme